MTEYVLSEIKPIITYAGFTLIPPPRVFKELIPPGLAYECISSDYKIKTQFIVLYRNKTFKNYYTYTKASISN